jgi:signal transduction histidine kinase
MSFAFASIAFCAVYVSLTLESRYISRQLHLMGSQLLGTLPTELNMLLPNIILEEQRGAVDLQLQRLLENESLSHTSVQKLPPPEKKGQTCKLGPQPEVQICVETSALEVTVIAPIQQGQTTYGYFIKKKRIDGSSSESRFNEPLYLLLFVLLVVFVLQATWTTYFLNRHIRRTLIDLEPLLANALSDQKKVEIETSSVSEIERVVERLRTLVTDYHKQKVESAIGLLARQVAHDIRSPLSALNLVASKLKLESPDHSQLLRQCISRINDIANELLLRSKLQSLNPPEAPRPSNFDVVSEIEELVKLKRAEYAHRTHVQIEYFATEASIFAVGPVTEIRRALSNLVNNALEAIPKDQLGLVTLSVSKDASNVTIKIEDNGQGMTKETLSRLGEIGFSSGKTGSSGAGLGFYHARKTFEGCGGQIKIESKVGEGTQIQLHLKTE